MRERAVHDARLGRLDGEVVGAVREHPLEGLEEVRVVVSSK